MNKELDIMEIYHLIIEFFGNKVDVIGVIESRQEIECILYSSFVLKCGIEDRYKMFECGIMLEEKYAIRNILGESPSLNNDRDSIIKSLKLMDKYCRLRLPDKFLDEYDKLQ